ncbi:MAG TPA: carboxypeptidase regulatory-like domain-containing protein [Candidatus Sulfotelmatobacter sp.]|nr:carboxypeptidase regulatory-like domain-containing protein [Candidatus Sulfotelmatobacter sp.]
MKWPLAVLGLSVSVLSLAGVLAFGKDASVPQTPAQDAKAAVTGTVSDQAGAGVAGATVTMDGDKGSAPSATTDGQGLYAITDLPAGTYTMSVVSHGGKLFQANLLLSPGQVLTMSVAGALPGPSTPSADQATAPATGAAITGTVSDLAGAGLAGATLSIDDGKAAPRTVATDGQGLYAITDLSAGSYSLSVLVQGAKIFQANLTLGSGQVLTMSVAGAPVAQTSSLAPPSSQAPTAPAPNTPAAGSQPVGAASPAATPAAPAPSDQSTASPAAQTAAPSVGAFSGPGIGGSVTDETGAVLVGATVKVSNASGVVQSVVSDDKGSYAFRDLPPGSYNITATMQGFKAFEADGVTLAPGQSLPLDVSMQPAGEETKVNVEGQKIGEVETETAQVSGTITQKEVLSLGLNGRNFTQLIALTPGVTNQTGQDEAHVGITGSVKYSVNGGRVEYNTFEADGSDVLNAGLNGAESTLIVYPSLDAIQEVKVLTSNYGAMYGRTASGTVMVTTKSGTPKWHGDGYEFLRNEAFNARNYFDPPGKAPLYRRNDFGFTIGGPLFIPNAYNTNKDKTFFFWSEEFRFEKSPTDQQPDFNRGVPSLAERQGDFSDVCPPYVSPFAFNPAQWPDCPSAGLSSVNFGYRLMFPNNNIAQLNAFGGLDPNAVALLNTNLIPLPNSATGCNSSIGSCYDAVISEPTHWREELINLDHNFTSKVQASFHYIHDAWNTIVPVPQWQHLPGNVVNSFPTVQNKFVGPGIVLAARLTQTISPTLLNVTTGSFTNSHITLANTNGPGGANYLRPAGLGQPGGPCQPGGPPGMPNGSTSCPLGAIFNNGFGGKAPGIVFTGSNQAYGGSGFTADTSYMPWEHTNPAFSFRDDLSKAIKSHTLQFGVQVIFSEKNETNESTAATPGDVQGLLTFSNINGGVENTGNAFANFLTLFSVVGSPNSIQSYTQDSAQSRYYNRYRIGEPYIQDDWKVNSRLTLNLGVRFSLFGLYHERYLREWNWVPSAYNPTLATQVGVDPTTGQLVSGPQNTPIPINLSSPDPHLLNGLVQCGTNHVPAGCMSGHLFNPAPRVGVAWDPFGDGKTSIRAGYGMFFEHGTGEEANTGSLEGSAPNVLSMTQRFPQNYGCIGGSAVGCGVQPGAYPLNVTAIPTRAVWPYAQQWSLSVQRELPKSMVATVAYVGSRGTHLTVERELNQLKPLPAALNPFGIHQPIVPQATVAGLPGDCGGFTGQPGTPGTFHLLNGTVITPQDPAYINLEAACTGENGAQNLTPDVNTLRPYPGFGEIFSLQNVADSSYHAFQTTVRRTKGPLTVGGSYSFSHSIDDSSDRSDATLVNSYDLRSNKANSNFDERHLLTISYIYAVPNLAQGLQHMTLGRSGEETGDGQDPVAPGAPSRLLHLLGDGWQFSGITSYQSGTPFSVINGGSTTISVLDNAGVANGIGAGSYPDVIGDPHATPPSAGNNSRSFGPLLGNPGAFAAPRGLTFGTAGRNFFNNPGRLNFDLSLLKHFPIRESGVLEFRAEAFNIFNHTQFRLYDPNFGNTGSNTISCYGGPNYSAGFSTVGETGPGGVPIGGTDCLTGNSFLHPVDAHRPRTVQFGLKFSF